MRTKRLERLWIQFGAMFGSRWALEYGPATDRNGALAPIAEIWARALDGASNEQIAAGLKACLSRESDRMLTLPEFLRLCGAGMESRRPEYRAQHLLPNPDDARKRIDDLAATLQAEANDALAPRLARAATPQQRQDLIRAYWTSRIGQTLIGRDLARRWEGA